MYSAEKHRTKMQDVYQASIIHRLAAKSIESLEVAQAMQNSLQESQQETERMQEARALVNRRLLSRGMRAVLTPGLGDCFFVALVETAGLPMSSFDLRQQVCEYLELNKEWFLPCFADASALESHIQAMRSEGVWATAFEITAASHLTLRPIHLITDHAEDPHSTTVIEPPLIYAATAWQPTVYLAHFLQCHFEGTTAAEI